ncbi:hypothetical protein EBR43_12295 [bacterium]|nr:hypothetical protein [bacterium]
MKIRRDVKVKFLRVIRFFSRIWNKAIKSPEMNPDQKRGLKIFDETISIKDVSIFISPLSDIIYVYANETYLVIENHTLKVINGMYKHEFQYDDKGRTRMRNRVFYILEKRREEIDAKIRSKNDKSLDYILEDILEFKQKKH